LFLLTVQTYSVQTSSNTYRRSADHNVPPDRQSGHNGQYGRSIASLEREAIIGRVREGYNIRLDLLGLEQLFRI
jgi:hypothetical protein